MSAGLRIGDLVETADGVGSVTSRYEVPWVMHTDRVRAYVIVELSVGHRRTFRPVELMAERDETTVCACGAVFERPRGSFRFVRCGDCRGRVVPSTGEAA